MPERRLEATESTLRQKFGGGVHTRAPEDEINERESADGQNYVLDAENSDFRPRPPFDLVATAPNAGQINGAGSYRKRDGTVIAFVQAGSTVYSFDGSSFDASPVLDTVSSAAKLRGHWRSHAWELDDKILISDLALAEPVKEWDGTTWQDVTFLSNPSTTWGSEFRCKYISIANERAWFSNIFENSAAFPQLIIGSKISQFELISINDRPSSSLGADDPFYMVTPDVRGVNGFVEAFGSRIISTDLGRMFEISGNSPQDFAIDEFYPNSYASGDESVAYIGNDIIYGRPGRIEGISDTQRYGDVSADDLSRQILDTIKSYTAWTAVYNSRLDRVYMFPTGQSEVWVYDKAVASLSQRNMSPWVKWTTQHSLGFMPTMVMSMLDPSDGLEYVFMGDSSGNLYRLEGTGTSGDGGTDEIVSTFTSRLYSAPVDATMNHIDGYIKYRNQAAAYSATIELLWHGENVRDDQCRIDMPSRTAGPYYNNNSYYNNDENYGTAFLGRLRRQYFQIPGGDSNEFQLRVSVTTAKDFDINEIGLKFSTSS